MASLSQGFMLGMYIMGLHWGWAEVAFAALTAVALTVAYSFIGAAWVIFKTDGDLQRKAVKWAQGGIWGVVIGMGAVSAATPLVSERIFDKWFRFPEIVTLAPLPLMAGALVALLWIALRRLPTPGDHFAWFPFAAATALMVLGFSGMAYSFYPFIVPEKLTILEAAAATESLSIILVGVMVVLPVILCYTVLAYTIFRGKATALRYD
jgi:cytochrome d ubiquinol oxidase subunit II